ncbi:host attachment protein [Erythrobacter sp.]|uniref:baeRF12 domain-containing protein n=1 Tax=Erythrobacter sp. TaxID=1042 RepID=UPI001425F3B8|nr:host attachment protein [Erythrobacter sp.]QIQ85699.1 MAG: host attachment protein [Erythrobacter sp.]
MILPSRTLVLVTDGARMVLMRNAGDALAPRLEVIEHREVFLVPNRDLFSDRPGTTFSSHGDGRSRYEAGDPHAAEEEEFLVAAIAALAEFADERTPAIVIAADPVSLGRLRGIYPPFVRKRLMAEIDRDYTAMPVAEIAHRLLAA